MRKDIGDALWVELGLRGFVEGVAPNASITLGRDYLSAVDVTRLLASMAARGEKVGHSTPIVGRKLAREAVEDVALAISAISVVIERFLASTPGSE